MAGKGAVPDTNAYEQGLEDAGHLASTASVTSPEDPERRAQQNCGTGPQTLKALRKTAADACVKVNLTRKARMTKRDEYIFTTDKGSSRSTDRDNWTKTEYGGKIAWCYWYKGVYYYVRKKPGV